MKLQLSMKRYTVIDYKKNVRFSYYQWQWQLAFALIYFTGMVTGILIGLDWI